MVPRHNLFIVAGNRSEDGAPGELNHRGIASCAFERRFQLADFVDAGEATVENEMVSIALKRVVLESMKPRRIKVSDRALPPIASRRQGRLFAKRHCLMAGRRASAGRAPASHDSEEAVRADRRAAIRAEVKVGSHLQILL